jgi:hypothetical protein
MGCSDRARLAIALFLPGDDLTVLVPVLEQFVVSYTLNIYLLEEILLSEECLKYLESVASFYMGVCSLKWFMDLVETLLGDFVSKTTAVLKHILLPTKLNA